jgi:hypothetical protein
MAQRRVAFGNSQVRNLNVAAGTVVNYGVGTHNFNGEGAAPSSRVQAEQKANPNAFNPVKRFNNTYRSPNKKEAKASRASFLKVKSLYGDRWTDATVAIDTYAEEKEELEKGYRAKFMEIYAREIGGGIEGNLASEIVETIEEMNKVSLDLTNNKLSAEEAQVQLSELMQDGEIILGVADFANKYKPFKALFLEHQEMHKASKLRRNKTLKNIKKNLAKRRVSVYNNNS